MAPKPAPECSAKQALTEDIRTAMTALIALNNREMDAVSKGKPIPLEAIRVELVEARKRKDMLLEQYNDHVLKHRC